MDRPLVEAIYPHHASSSPEMVGTSLIMRQLQERVSCLATSDAPVLVTGERGTGKKLVARELHLRGARRLGPLVVVPPKVQRAIQRGPSEVDEPLARELCADWVKDAEGGTLVLDGVDEQSPRAQMMLARVLRDLTKTVSPMLTPRLVSLAVQQAAPPHALQVTVPALRDREGDIHPLVRHFLKMHGGEQRPVVSLDPRAWRVLMFHAFPGNVRELGWVVEQALLRSASHGRPVLADRKAPGARSQDVIGVEHLPPELVRAQMSGVRVVSSVAHY
jgi:DNA-binding NtrC family response regulator